MSEPLPLQFYLCCLSVGVLFCCAWRERERAWGIPAMAVTATAAAWYLGDPLYNDYTGYFQTAGEAALSKAWWEVLLFFISFGILAPLINQRMNGGLEMRSRLFRMIRNREVDEGAFQAQITKTARILILPWLILMMLALLRTDFDFIGIFFPYLGEKAEPWGRDRMGGGIDALYSLATYLQILLTALFGVLFALAKTPATMTLSGLIYSLSVPFFLFDRTRNTMLAVLLPGLMAFTAIRLRGGVLIRILFLVFAFLALEGWMKFVIVNRSSGNIAEVFHKGESLTPDAEAPKHLGFNMLEELGYINRYISEGTYRVNWGERYFAEAVNPIPRVLWPGKPMIGIDYAIARGMAYGNLAESSGGVAASISTGMIGQGVVNFGPLFGPMAAALLMAVWVSMLARQDLKGNDLGHLLLYAVGLVLTFNMGRDITLLVIYPFVFGSLLLYWVNRRKALKPILSHCHAA